MATSARAAVGLPAHGRTADARRIYIPLSGDLAQRLLDIARDAMVKVAQTILGTGRVQIVRNVAKPVVDLVEPAGRASSDDLPEAVDPRLESVALGDLAQRLLDIARDA